MKLINKTNRKLKPGVTLIELTVVIVVILALISVLFVGATAYRNGANRSACIIKINAIQKAVRGHQNMNGGLPTGLMAGGYANAPAMLLGDQFFPIAPTCPTDNTTVYTFTGGGTNYPAVGATAVTCALVPATHFPTNTAGW